MSDNKPVDAPGALLIAPDPTGQSDVRFEHICDLSPDAYARYKDTYKTLEDILFSNTFAYFKGSAKVFFTVWTQANKALAAGEIRPTHDPDNLVLWGTQLRSVALTLCLSLCYHQEQMLQEICHTHGTGSDAHNEAKTLFGNLNDTHAGYRYMYALRNVMIHDAMDAIALEATAALDQNRQPVAIWDLQLDRKFLATSKKLNAAKRAEFASLTENPSLPDLFARIAKPMVDANTELLGILHPDLTDVCQVAVEFDQLFDDRVGTRVLVHRQSPEMQPGMKIGMSPWSNKLLQFARNYQPEQEIRR